MRRAISAAVLGYALLWLLGAAYLASKANEVRRAGWHAVATPGALTVTQSEPWTGLRPGDRVLAFNGDSGITDTGAEAYLLRYPSGKAYRLAIRRGADVREIELHIVVEHGWAVGQNFFLLIVGGLCCLMSTWIIRADPESSLARTVWGAGMLAALEMLNFGVQPGPWFGWAPAIPAYFLFWVGPWKLYATYCFAAALPTGAPETGWWRWLKRGLLGFTVLVSLYSLPFEMRTLALSGRPGAWSGRLVLAPWEQLPVWDFALALFGAAMVAVVARNYRRLESEDARRRVRWVVLGFSVAGGSLAAAVLLVAFGLGPASLVNWAQVPLVSIPLSLGYAILAHRVLGIRVVVRRGLQYLLARRTVEVAALLLPAAMAVEAFRNPQLTLGQVLDRPLLYVAALGAIAMILLAPRILDLLDRRFFREEWDQEQILSGLAAAIQRQISFQDTVDLVCRRIEQALHPEMVEVLYRPKRGAPLTGLAAARCVELALTISAEDGSDAGVLLLGPKKSEEPYTARDRELLRAVVEHLGLALSHRHLAIERADAVLEERTRIARELHDTLAQGFAGISLHLESARLALADGGAGAERHLEQARQLARSSLAEARRSVHDLRETVRQSTELRRQIEKLAAELTAGTPVEVAVETRGERPLPESVGDHLFRIAQESIANALKHSGATRIQVVLEFAASAVVLRVRDNGRGFDPARTQAGYGLAGMRERAVAIHGDIEVRSSGEGTEVCAFAHFA